MKNAFWYTIYIVIHLPLKYSIHNFYYLFNLQTHDNYLQK